MRYRDWLNLNLHLLWCHNLPVARGRADAGQPVMRSTEYINSAAWFVREGWAEVEHDGQRHRADGLLGAVGVTEASLIGWAGCRGRCFA